MSAAMNPMNQLRITKVCVNIGVGEGGERLVNAENVLEMVTGVKPQRTLGRIQNRDLKVKKHARDRPLRSNSHSRRVRRVAHWRRLES